MTNDDLVKLQRYIVKRNQNQNGEQVIAHIEKVYKKSGLTDEQWERLLSSACYYCAYVEEYDVFEYILNHVGEPKNISDCIQAVVRTQEKRYYYILKRIAILKKLLPYIKETEKREVLSEALLLAAWYGELGVVKFLIDNGADIRYRGKQGKDAFEFSQTFNERFSDDKLYQYLKPYYENGKPLGAIEPYYEMK